MLATTGATAPAEATETPPQTRGKKRTRLRKGRGVGPTRTGKGPEPELRRRVLERGGHLFNFADPVIPCPLSRSQQFRSLERKGFLVTRDGCIYSSEYLWKTTAGSSFQKGHRASVQFFTGNLPKRQKEGEPKRTNQHGWPNHEEVSHLCHRHACIRPDHLVIEEYWRNRKRNYCGVDGHCDCGQVPPCVRTYKSVEDAAATTFEGDPSVLLDKLSGPLAALFLIHPFKLLPRKFYDKQDAKKQHRNQRLRKTRKHKEEALRHALALERLLPSAAVEEEESFEDDEEEDEEEEEDNDDDDDYDYDSDFV